MLPHGWILKTCPKEPVPKLYMSFQSSERQKGVRWRKQSKGPFLRDGHTWNINTAMVGFFLRQWKYLNLTVEIDSLTCEYIKSPSCTNGNKLLIILALYTLEMSSLQKKTNKQTNRKSKANLPWGTGKLPCGVMGHKQKEADPKTTLKYAKWSILKQYGMPLKRIVHKYLVRSWEHFGLVNFKSI